MPNVNGIKCPYTAKCKEEAKKAVAATMSKKRKAAAPTRMIASGGPTKPKSPSGMLMQPSGSTPAKARAYGEAPNKAMPSKKMIDKKFGK
jgi:hypothetical protein